MWAEVKKSGTMHCDRVKNSTLLEFILFIFIKDTRKELCKSNIII